MKTTNNGTNDVDDNFEIFLRKQLQRDKAYLNDQYFSASVIAALPPVKKAIHWREHFIMLIPLAIISVLVLSQQSVLAFFIKAWVLASVANTADVLGVLLQASVMAMLVVGYWFIKRYRIL